MRPISRSMRRPIFTVTDWERVWGFTWIRIEAHTTMYAHVCVHACACANNWRTEYVSVWESVEVNKQQSLPGFVRGKELVRANVLNSIWGERRRKKNLLRREGERLSVSSVAGDVFCLVTAGTAIGQSDQHIRFEWGGPSCLLLSCSGFLLLYFIRRSCSHSMSVTRIHT